jgi:hypothetical protein
MEHTMALVDGLSRSLVAFEPLVVRLDPLRHVIDHDLGFGREIAGTPSTTSPCHP